MSVFVVVFLAKLICDPIIFVIPAQAGMTGRGIACS